MAQAANQLLDALSDTQREQATWPFPSNDERRLWFYTPTNHGGLPLTEMDSVQHRLVWRLLATGLSEPGYNTAAVIVGLENVLDYTEGFGADFGRGTGRGRDPLLYWISIFGEPAAGGTWSWRFGGHHISLHFTIVDGRVRSTTPCFFGADPASAPLLGPHLHRPLAAVEDLARELVHSLDDAQRSAAVRSSAPPPDLIGVNRTTLTEGDQSLPLPLLWRGRLEEALDQMFEKWQERLEASLGGDPQELAGLSYSATPKGLGAASMSSDQQEILRALLGTYVGRIHDDLADGQLAKVAGDAVSNLHFLWAGGIEVGAPHYYRVQGGDLLVEYDNAQRDGNHIHTVWRDLSMEPHGDFGGDPLAEHYAHQHGAHHHGAHQHGADHHEHEHGHDH